MKFERGTSNTFVLPARPTLTPSNWLLRFVRVENGVEMLCIADAYTQPGKPVQVTFTEVNSSPDPLDGEITLQAGQWEVHVYEQTSATNLNYTQAPREPFATLVLVEGAAIAPPPPTDPCGGDCPATTVNGTESDVPDITVLQGGVEVGTLNPATGVHTVPECEECDPLQIFVNGEFLLEVEEPCGASPGIRVNDELGGDTGSKSGTIWVIPSVTVLRDGLPYSTEVPGATVDVPSDCPECAPATYLVNDTLVDTAADPCGHAFNLPVKNEDATPVGSLVDGEWIVPTAKSLCALVTEGTSEEVAICVISSGKRAGVLAELIPTVDAADAVDDVFTPLSDDGELAVGDYLYSDYLCSDADAARYIASIQAWDGQMLEPAVRTAICTLFASLKAGGTPIWNSIDDLVIMGAARTLAGALQPLKGRFPTNFNFVDADYNRETGLRGNGTTKYLRTNRNNADTAQNNDHNFVYVTEQHTAGTAGSYMRVGVADNGSNQLLRSAMSPFNVATRSRSATATVHTSSGTGYFGITRSAGASYDMRINGVDTNIVVASQAPLSRDIFVFAGNDGTTTPIVLTDARLFAYGTGTNVNQAAYQTILDTYYAAIASAIP